MTDSAVEAQLRPYLRSGERLVWTGAPRKGVIFSGADILLIPFSLLWGGFAIVWEYIALSARHAPKLFPLFGVPFVLVGLFLIFGRFIVDAWVRARTIYGLTDTRALVLRRLAGERLAAAGLDDEVRIKTQADGRGTLEFGAQRNPFSGMRGVAGWMPSLSDQVRFIGIENVMDVYRRINPQLVNPLAGHGA
jgi:hypothetical protein